MSCRSAWLRRSPRAEPIANNIFMGWDGEVFICCNEFEKKNPIGDLTRRSLDEVWDDTRRWLEIAGPVAGASQDTAICHDCA